MPSHTVKRLVKLLNGEMLSKEFLVCGVGYRQETGDTRHSPSEVLIAEIEGLGGNVTAYDPYVSFWVEMGRQLPEELPNPSLFDAIIFAVPHEEFMLLDIVKWLGDTRPLVLDAVNAIDYWKRIACREIGVQIESIGRGDGL